MYKAVYVDRQGTFLCIAFMVRNSVNVLTLEKEWFV